MPEDFRQHILTHGYATSDAIVFDGKIHRPRWQGSSRGKSGAGWYVGFDHGDFKAAAWGDWSDGVRLTWTSKSDRKLSSADREDIRRKIEAAKAAADKARLLAQACAARSAARVWSLCPLATADNPYCQKKGIAPDRLRAFRDGALVVGLMDESGEVVNLQVIRPNGDKRFLKNGAVIGAHWRAGAMPADDHDGDVIVTEGVATAATIHKLTGTTVFAAMNANNLETITKWLRKRWPFARLIIAGDDDRFERDGSPRPLAKNVGRTKAAAACAETRGLAVFPSFQTESRGTDWNDLMTEEGADATLRKWLSAINVASLDRRIATLSDAQWQTQKTGFVESYRNAGIEKPGLAALNARRKEVRADTAKNAPPSDDDEDETPCMMIYKLAAQEDYWHDQFRTPYVTYQNDGVKQNAPVTGAEFLNWLRMEYEAANDAPAPLPKSIYDAVVAQLAAKALTKCAMHKSYYRMAEIGGVRWLDLGRADWLAVRITAEGWQVMPPAVKFVRSDDDSTLPVPVSGGTLAPLWDIINVAEEDRCLVAGWLINCLLASASMYGLNIYGSQGSAKSSASKILRRITDPSSALTQTLSENRIDELLLTCRDQWVPIFENVSSMSYETQDALCRLSTGDADRRRKLYTDHGMSKSFVLRPWIVNGITNVCTRGDLAERAVPVELSVITSANRLTEHSIEALFAASHASILGCLLDAAVAGMAEREETEQWAKANQMTHRMADAAMWVSACEPHLGFPRGSFISRLTATQEADGAEVLSEHPVTLAIQEVLEAAPRNFWRGSLSSLLNHVKPHNSPGKFSVDSAQKLGSWLAREGPRLRASMGISVSEKKKNRPSAGGKTQWLREIEYIKTDTPTAEETPEQEQYPF